MENYCLLRVKDRVRHIGILTCDPNYCLQGGRVYISKICIYFI